ncbi:MAG: hypothetical protein MUF17_12380 [Syntrophales bacterium]|nr:hypothetical protein [Syntrophales bacterium]
MRDIQRQMSEWISRNRRDLIRCPHQPGNLLITRQGCHRRQTRARKEDLTNVMQGDVMDYIYRQGLSICLTCTAAKRKAA